MLLDVALAVVEHAVGEVLDDQKILLDRLSETCHRLEAKLDQRVLVEARAGVDHLMAAARAEQGETRREELALARGQFTKLLSLPPEGQTGGVENKTLMGLGAWGSFYVAALRGEKREALRQVYSFTKEWPEVGVMVFPAELFSQEWRGTAARYVTRVKAAEDRLKATLKTRDSFWSRFDRAVTGEGQQLTKEDYYQHEVVSDAYQRLRIVMNPLVKECVDRLSALDTNPTPSPALSPDHLEQRTATA